MKLSDKIKSRLTNSKIAFIGAGKMAEALIKGMFNAQVIAPDQVILSDVQRERLLYLKEKYQVDLVETNAEAVKRSQIVFLSVKPQQIDGVLQEIAPSVCDDHLIISVAAGITAQRICQQLNRKAAVIKVMPNTPALVGAGISVVSRGEFSTPEDESLALALFAAVGEVVSLPENLQNEAMALSGCGPAYFYLFIKALVEAGAEAGLSQEVALKLALETMVGAGEMLKKTGKEPQELIDMVTSPGGTTLTALAVFEEAGFQQVVLNAVRAAIKRAYELGS